MKLFQIKKNDTSTWSLIVKTLKTTHVLNWFTASWWQYLFEKDKYFRKDEYCSSWHRFWCRAAGHPARYWFYNVNGDEPDYTCRSCGDDLN